MKTDFLLFVQNHNYCKKSCTKSWLNVLVKSNHKIKLNIIYNMQVSKFVIMDYL